MMKGGSALDYTMSVGTSSCPQSPDLMSRRAPPVNGGRKGNENKRNDKATTKRDNNILKL
jgi:hypothetical protein